MSVAIWEAVVQTDSRQNLTLQVEFSVAALIAPGWYWQYENGLDLSPQFQNAGLRAGTVHGTVPGNAARAVTHEGRRLRNCSEALKPDFVYSSVRQIVLIPFVVEDARVFRLPSRAVSPFPAPPDYRTSVQRHSTKDIRRPKVRAAVVHVHCCARLYTTMYRQYTPADRAAPYASRTTTHNLPRDCNLEFPGLYELNAPTVVLYASNYSGKPPPGRDKIDP
ncbi:hypothetical protein OIDMADRAFT_177154 [Oidiodendron maius Zn]|uniref:Uncharacterized protein n=1 Tax=Oidiodendron maius (strain Zn) TaxID=913774 RepID=A0A0C3HR91_OIDMZ|nr:hypothetical protein OIDMADRAFT_177154 [Oidiodendron maius Zn]